MLEKTNFALIALVAFVARLVVKGACVGDALAVAALAGLYGWQTYLSSRQTGSLNDQVKEELAGMRAILNALKVQKGLGR